MKTITRTCQAPGCSYTGDDIGYPAHPPGRTDCDWCKTHRQPLRCPEHRALYQRDLDAQRAFRARTSYQPTVRRSA